MIYEEYEQKCNEIRAKNAAYLDDFKEDLLAAGLKDRTINNHLYNVDFYINTYLLREEPLEMSNGANPMRINYFLGDFFIRKCMWSTPGTIKSTAASIKKFYSCMSKLGHVDELEYKILIETIKEDMDTWLSDCEDFNTSGVPNPFNFFF